MKAIVFILSVALVAIVFPLAANHHLRNAYRQTLAHWLSKAVPPPTVFIGDSIMNGGMWFDDVRNINLAANSLTTDQIAMRLGAARAYNPKRIVIMAGVNDAIRGFDAEKIRGLWETICKEPTLVVTLATPSIHDDLNLRINQINRIIVDTCPGTVITTLDVADEHGRLRPEYSLDGLHLGPRGYDRWITQLRALP
jgi:hypothetical protein